MFNGMFGRRLGAVGMTAALGMLGAAGLLRECTPPAPPSPPPAETAPSGVAAQVIALANAHRANMGVAPLVNNGALTTAATGHSQDQARRGTMTHTGANGSNPGERISFAGFRSSTWAENVAAGQPTPEAVITAWMNSPGHRANILNGRMTSVGIGAATGANGVIYWTMDLAAG